MITANEALKRLQDGNARFASGVRSIDTLVKQIHRTELVARQEPFARILGCSDSRVPAELVFDQGLGDLFVIRVAGNVVAPSQIGSVEFAAQRFGTPLVVVLGHSMCGTVAATIDDLTTPSESHTSSILSIINRIRPTVEPLFHTELRNDPERLLDAAIRANILAATNQRRHGSSLIEQSVQDGTLTTVGAEYSVENGRVELFDGL